MLHYGVSRIQRVNTKFYLPIHSDRWTLINPDMLAPVGARSSLYMVHTLHHSLNLALFKDEYAEVLFNRFLDCFGSKKT